MLACAAPPTIDTVCGTARSENNGDAGQALATNVGEPSGVEIGPDGALYVTKVRNHRVRRVNLKTGELTTIAGNECTTGSPAWDLRWA